MVFAMHVKAGTLRGIRFGPRPPRGPEPEPDYNDPDAGMRYHVLRRMRESADGAYVRQTAVEQRISDGKPPWDDVWYDEVRRDKSDEEVLCWHLDEVWTLKFWKLMGKRKMRGEVYFFAIPGLMLGLLLWALQWLAGALGGIPYVGIAVNALQGIALPVVIGTSITGFVAGGAFGWMRAYSRMFVQSIILDGGKRHLLAAFPQEFLIKHATLTATGDFLLILPPKACCVEAGGGDNCDCGFRPFQEADLLLAKPAASTDGDPEAANRYLLVKLFGMVGKRCTPLPDPESGELLKRAGAITLVVMLYVVGFFLIQS